MKSLTPKLEKKLRGLAHHFKPIVMVGQKGITPNVIQSLNDALACHELLKLKFQDCKDQKKELSLELEQKTESHLVGLIGNIAIYYKQNTDPKKRKIEL